MEPPPACEAIEIDLGTARKYIHWTSVVRVRGIMGRLFWPPERIVPMVCPPGNIEQGVAMTFGICSTVPGVIAAGGSVSCCIESHVMYRNRDNMASDLDLYIRANSAEEGYATTHRLLELLKPDGDVTLTKHALSFEVRRGILDRYVMAAHLLKPHNYDQQRAAPSAEGNVQGRPVSSDSLHRVQILSRLVPDTGDICKDIGQVLSEYDLAMCSFATDGKHVYGTEEAMRCMFGTRVASVHWSRLTSPARLVKYHERMFDFEIVGPDNTPLSIDAASEGARCIERRLQERTALNNYGPGGGATRVDTGSEDLDDRHETGYDSGAFIYDSRRVNSLDASLQKFMAGDTTAACLMQMVHGDGAAELDKLLRTGSFTAAYLTDWKYMAMNSFCDKFLSQIPPPSQDAIDAAYTEFIDKIDRFERLVLQELRVTPLFGSGHARTSDGNTDFESFRRMWCQPMGPPGKRPAESPLLGSSQKRSRTDGAADANASAVAAAEPSYIVAPNLPTNFSRGKVPEFSLEESHVVCPFSSRLFFLNMRAPDGANLHRRLEIMTPELDIPCGVRMWDRGRGVPQIPTDVLCSLGDKWESNGDRADFYRYMADVYGSCVKAILQYGIGKPFCKDATGVVRSFAPIIEARNKPSLDTLDDLDVYPPSLVLQFNYETQPHSVVALQRERDGPLTLIDPAQPPVVNGDHTITAHIRLDWIHRRPIQRRWRFGVRCTILQAIIRQRK